MYRRPIQCTLFIKYTQFRYHCYLKSPKEIVQETEFFGKCFIGADFGVTFGVNCDLKGRRVLTRRLWELCHTVVAKMLHRCYAFSSFAGASSCSISFCDSRARIARRRLKSPATPAASKTSSIPLSISSTCASAVWGAVTSGWKIL